MTEGLTSCQGGLSVGCPREQRECPSVPVTREGGRDGCVGQQPCQASLPADLGIISNVVGTAHLEKDGVLHH